MTPLPPPVRKYCEANAAMDLEAMLAPFAPTAIVRDEGPQHEGTDAIRSWIATATVGNAVLAVPAASCVRETAHIVEATVSSSFDGSPLRLEFRFRLQGDEIAALEIG